MLKAKQDDAHKNKIYCGIEIFAAIKKEMGVLRGGAFSFKYVKFVCDECLHPRQMLTLDKELKKLLKELEVKFQENEHGHR
ncbi:hypothetical protein [Pseudoalteromonas sp. S8-8]|uniref:hypothetical protein n=1 Tax=Pseudoalteromonas sp. S8-8 TaxID=1333520 RepID=UPI0003FB5533|nr:hypothetical protein [Pseudoalteromonas sp. S8-8]